MAREMSRAALERVDNVKPIGDAERKRLFGTFSYREGTPRGAVVIDAAWRRANIVSVTIPQLTRIERPLKSGTVACHRLIAAQLQRCWELIEQLGHLPRVLTYDGLFVPRHMGWDPKRPLSNHTWGTAWDINAAWNGYGRTPAKRGSKGSVWELVGIAQACGFAWGGHWTGSYADGMHFEAFRVVPANSLPVCIDAVKPQGKPVVDLPARRRLYADTMHQPLAEVYGAAGAVLADMPQQTEFLRRLNGVNAVLTEAGVK